MSSGMILTGIVDPFNGHLPGFLPPFMPCILNPGRPLGRIEVSTCDVPEDLESSGGKTAAPCRSERYTGPRPASAAP